VPRLETADVKKEYEWIFQAAIALSTFLAVVIALFGDWIKTRLFRPQLRLTLDAPRGVFQKTQLLLPDGSNRLADSRYYHLRVRNTNTLRWPIATQVQVYLQRIEEPRADGELAIAWTGEIPVRWRNQEINPLVRSIGPEADVDLLQVVEDKWIGASPLIVPIGFPLHQRREPIQNAVMTLQARSAEVDSPIVRISVSWNGRWADGEAEMANNLVVKVVEPLDV
jgi:hypothetical protein